MAAPRRIHVNVSCTVDWLPADHVVAAFGLALPRLQPTMTSAHARSSASSQAIRAREAAMRLSRRAREQELEGEDPRTAAADSTSQVSPRPSPGRSTGTATGAAHTYSQYDVAVLLSLAHYHRSAATSAATSTSPFPQTPVSLPAFTMHFDASCVDVPLSRLVDLARQPGVSSIPQLRVHLYNASRSEGPGPGLAHLDEQDPRWIAACLRHTFVQTEETGAVHGDEASSLQSRFRTIAETANRFVTAVEGANDNTSTSPRPRPLVVGTSWDGIALTENVRPDLLCANATFDAKTSVSVLDPFLMSLKLAREAQVTVVSDMLPGNATSKIKVDMINMAGEVMDDNRHSGALSLLVQAITQMQCHGTPYAVISSWDKGLVLHRTGPTTFSLSDWFMRIPPGRDRLEATTFAVFCSLLLSDPSARLPTWIDMVTVDAMLRTVRVHMQRLKAAQQAPPRVPAPLTSTTTTTTTALPPQSRDNDNDDDDLMQGLPPLDVSSSASAEQSSPLTPTRPHPHPPPDRDRAHRYPIWSSPSSSSSLPRHSPPISKRAKAAPDAPLHITLSVQLMSKMRHVRVKGSRLVPVDLLPEYDFTPWDDGGGGGDDACHGSSAGIEVRLDDFDSEGRYWTAYRGMMDERQGQGQGQEVIVKICRLAAFAASDDDDESDEVSYAEAIGEILNELRVLRSPIFRHRVTCTPTLHGVWNGTLATASASDTTFEAEAEMIKHEYALVVVVLEDVGPACSPWDMHAHRDEIVAAFEQLHEAGLIHGDVAPRHVRTGRRGASAGAGPSASASARGEEQPEPKARVRLIDFGRTRSGSDDQLREERQAVEDMLDTAAWSSVYAR